uniref:EF-hand domain-containing protein n=1 Tax=Zooxanthella nutricula TaxID=1333877 RepID=A0A6U6NZG7_9DINO|mmetsp:Transcript_53758/g.163255  ORF Transcript_53758/g.163255 Transcript_53758/m.163255 type:complete len:195 (+) Transcript_53758:21-605(+)
MAGVQSDQSAPSLQKLRKVIKEAFSNFDKIGNNTVQPDEVGTIMRYLGQFPSESDLKDTIIPELLDEEPNREGLVTFDAFEKVMLRNMMDRVYDPDDSETLLAAFRVLDPEGRGYIDSNLMHEHLSSGEGKAASDAFRDREMSDFVEYAKDRESADSSRIYYEDYVAKLTADIEKHLEHLYQDARGSGVGPTGG